MSSEVNETLSISHQAKSCYLPPRVGHVPEDIRAYISFLYLLTGVFSLLGNSIVIIVQLFATESSRSLRKYLTILALSDTTLSLLAMNAVYSNLVIGYWYLPDWLCPTGQYLQFLTAFITSGTLTIIALERYIVTLHPQSGLTRWFKRHNFTLLLLISLLGCIYAYIPTKGIVQIHAFTSQANITYKECIFNRVSLYNRLLLRVFLAVNFLLSYLIPLCIISASYVAIMRSIQMNAFTRYTSPGSNRIAMVYIEPNEVPSGMAKRLRVVKMMLVVILVYCLCWSPIKVLLLLREFGIINADTYCNEGDFYLVLYLFIGCHWLAVANSCANPIIYSFMSLSFRVSRGGITKLFINQIKSKGAKTYVCEPFRV